jgi:phosphoribosylaminoimidazole-succinocarboxamide synthase
MPAVSDTGLTTAFDDVELALPDRRSGKVRVSYALPPGSMSRVDDTRLFVTTDRLSAFDRVVACVPHKGQVLNQLAAWWFGHTADIVANHAVATPDPNALVALTATPLPVEVVVRGHITGVTSTALWTQYAAGARHLYGHHLPDGLRKNDQLRHPLVTPTTKAADGGHDEPLCVADVAERGLVPARLWGEVVEVALQLFTRGCQRAADAGLILADTKYEFGLAADGRLLLIDEVHTPDSSRWWIGGTYDERMRNGDEPESLDKEPVRRALSAAGYRGDGPPPALDESVWRQTSAAYVDAYERLTGADFQPGSYPVQPRLVANLTTAGLL